VCNSAREATLSYLAALLRNNEKRAQIQVDERSLASDGFMLNILSIMQLLAVKVRVSWKYMFAEPQRELDPSFAVLMD
jgi:ubiquitin conjugation factor E4 B